MANESDPVARLRPEDAPNQKRKRKAAAGLEIKAPSVRQVVEPHSYARLFEGHQDGPLVLDDLINRFARPAKLEGGIDAITVTYYRAGQRAVLDFVISMINRAHGVNDVHTD